MSPIAKPTSRSTVSPTATSIRIGSSARATPPRKQTIARARTIRSTYQKPPPAATSRGLYPERFTAHHLTASPVAASRACPHAGPHVGANESRGPSGAPCHLSPRLPAIGAPHQRGPNAPAVRPPVRYATARLVVRDGRRFLDPCTATPMADDPRRE